MAASRRRWPWMLAAIALVAAVWLLRDEPARERPGDPMPRAAARPPSPERSPARLPAQDPPAAAPQGEPPAEGSGPWQERMAETRRGLVAKLKYAPGATPLAGKTDLIPPHFVPPAERPLQDHKDPSKRGTADDQPGDVRITQRQSTLFLVAGERASASFQATLLDGTHPPVTIARAELAQEPAKSAPLPIDFHDDGVAPDELAGDGSYAAWVPPSVEALTGFGGELVVGVDVQVAGEAGTLYFRFAHTAAAPARFTHGARDALEDGSLAIYLGVEVYHPGRYEIRGRLYDGRNTPIALVTYIDELLADTREVRLLTYGKLLRDAGAQPPFTLRDIEGWHYLLGEYPDREMMVMWEAGYTTASYAADQLTDQVWDSPEKRAKIESFDNAVRAATKK